MLHSHSFAPVDDTSAWMVSAAHGDQIAWSRLVRDHEGWLIALVKKRIPAELRARFDEHDVVQEVLAAVCVETDLLARGDPVSFRRYLVEVLKHELLDELRWHGRARRNPRRERPESDGVLELQPGAESAPPEAAEVADLRASVERALELLSAADREILRRRFVEEETWVEISRELGVSEPTARRWGHEALDRVRFAHA